MDVRELRARACRERAAAEGLTPLAFMRRYGAFEIARGLGGLHEHEVPADELRDVAVGDAGRVYTAAPAPATANIVPVGAPAADGEGRRPAGVLVDGVVRRGFPTPSGRLEFWSSTLAAWGWPEHALPGYIRSHVHPAELEPGPDGAAVDLPAADPDPHPLGQQQVAGRAGAHQPASGSTPPTPPGSASPRPATWSGSRPRSATSWPRRGSPRASGPAWSPAPTTWAAGSSPVTTRSARAG